MYGLLSNFRSNFNSAIGKVCGYSNQQLGLFKTPAGGTNKLLTSSLIEKSTLSSTGSLIEKSTLSSTGSLIEKSTLSSTGSLTEESTLSSTGSLTEESTLSSTGSLTEESTLSSTGSLTEESTLSSTGSLTEESTLSSTGSLTEESTLSSTGSLTEESTLSSTGSLTEESTLSSTGSLTEESTLSSTGSLTEESTLSSTGSLTEESTLSSTEESTGSLVGLPIILQPQSLNLSPIIQAQKAGRILEYTVKTLVEYNILDISTISAIVSKKQQEKCDDKQDDMTESYLLCDNQADDNEQDDMTESYLLCDNQADDNEQDDMTESYLLCDNQADVLDIEEWVMLDDISKGKPSVSVTMENTKKNTVMTHSQIDWVFNEFNDSETVSLCEILSMVKAPNPSYERCLTTLKVVSQMLNYSLSITQLLKIQTDISSGSSTPALQGQQMERGDDTSIDDNNQDVGVGKRLSEMASVFTNDFSDECIHALHHIKKYDVNLYSTEDIIHKWNTLTDNIKVILEFADNPEPIQELQEYHS